MYPSCGTGMIDCKCSFAPTMIREDYACEKARMVTRRAGPDISCVSEDASTRCGHLLEKFKEAGLEAFDAQDDLLKTPHSVYVKIQFGGLLGLARDVMHPSAKSVDNIFLLLDQAMQHYQSLDAIPCREYVSIMKKFKVGRKKR